MVVQDQLTLKTVILHRDAPDASAMPAYRLLNDLGHEVSATSSARDAVSLIQHDHADLVLVDADQPEQRQFVSSLSELPTDQLPGQVAIFTDGIDETLSAMVSKLERSKVNVLLRPLHVHGLLNMLRKLKHEA